MTTGRPVLHDPEDFPALYRTAGRTSREGQKRFLITLRIRLGALLLGSFGGLISLRSDRVHVGGFVALVAFLVALAIELYSAITDQEKKWYEGRAAAESVKTLTWRFIVRGQPFHEDDGQVEQRFIAKLGEILQDLGTVELAVTESPDVLVTEQMRRLRAHDFPVRRDLYLEGRIRDQLSWYSSKAAWNAKRGHLYLIASIAFEFLGVIAGAWLAFGNWKLDLLGPLAAIAATITAWVQAKQYQNLSTAYGLAALELATVASETAAITTEQTWGQFVDQAEEAISREHTLWRASRGLRIRPPGTPFRPR